MKRKITKVHPDGSKEIQEIDDEAPAMKKASQQPVDPKAAYLEKLRSGKGGNVAAQGQKGDTRLAHVNQWEEALLKKLGGAGTRNPRTGLKQFYTTGYDEFGNPIDDETQYETAGTGTQSAAPTLTAGMDINTPGIAPPQNTLAPMTTTAATDMFDIPTDIMPTSTSGSQSQSGLPDEYRNQLLASLMPQLQDSITNMPGNWDKYTQEALGSYQQQMNNALKQNIPAALRNMANRGIINSTEGQNVMGNVISSAARDASTKGYETAMQSALGKAGMPSILGQLAQLGSGTNSQSFSYSADPTVMWRDLSATIRAMMGG